MIFLIEYNRSAGHIVTFRDFDDSQRRIAEDSRLEIELDLNRKGIDHEVVLLEAASKDALHRTHQRYFADLTQILKSACRHNGNDKRIRASIPASGLLSRTSQLSNTAVSESDSKACHPAT